MSPEPAPRFRLRFLFQEFDISGPEVVLGRSPECHITIEDPMVSRKHAVIKVGEEGAVLHDAGSRNGVRLNGRTLREPTLLKDGDRIRIGTQELAFFVLQRTKHVGRPTGYMKICEKCQTPFPDGTPTCPHCGADADPEGRTDETTLSGMFAEPRRTWTLQLLGEVLEKALTMGRHRDAERLMQRCEEEISHRLRTGDKLLTEQLVQVTTFAMRLAALEGQAQWAKWSLNLCIQHQVLPHDETINVLKTLLANNPDLWIAVEREVVDLLDLAKKPSNFTDEEQHYARRLQRLYEEKRQ